MRLIQNGPGRHSSLPLVSLVVAAAGLLAACNTNRLLDVTTPDQVPVSILDGPGNAVLMVNSVVGDYQCAFGSAIVVEALLAGRRSSSRRCWPAR